MQPPERCRAGRPVPGGRLVQHEHRDDLIGIARPIPTQVLETVNVAVADADRRIEYISRRADDRMGEALDVMKTLESDAKPMMTNSASMVKDVQDSLDQVYPDIEGTVASATVAVTGIARASEAMGNAAPKVADAVVSMASSADGVAADVKREADELTKPKHWYDRILGPVYTLGRLVAAFL